MLKNHKRLAIGGLGATVLVLALLILFGYRAEWTGFGSRVDAKGALTPEKTLWDWLELIIVPAVLFLARTDLTRFGAVLEDRRWPIWPRRD
jgi:hypothetical protein